jgi:hypothetical protein
MSDNIAEDRFADQGVQPIAEGRPKVNDPANLDVLTEYKY